ncbi:MAG: hypothetical protein AAF371_06650 [Pseudomonadota bacterium]
MIILWTVMGALAGAASLALLARETRRIARTRRLGAFLLGGAARVLGVVTLCFFAFRTGPEAGLGFIAAFAVTRLLLLRFSTLAEGG